MKSAFPRICLLCAIFILFSCDKKPDMQTLRLYAQAGELYSNGKFSETAMLLSSIRNFPPALVLRAKAEYFSGDLDKAEKFFRQAAKQKDNFFEAQLYLARILREKGETEKAKKITETLLGGNSRDMRLLRFAAALALEEGDSAGASVFLDQAVDICAEGAAVLLDRARLRWISGRGKDALDDLSRAKAILPWDTPIIRSINQLEYRITEAMQ